MLRSYDFYKVNFDLEKEAVDYIIRVLNDVENGIINEQEIRNLGSLGLKVCLTEGRYTLFKKLVSPFSYEDKEGIGYKYLLDAFTLGLVEYINECSNSIMEH